MFPALWGRVGHIATRFQAVSARQRCPHRRCRNTHIPMRNFRPLAVHGHKAHLSSRKVLALHLLLVEVVLTHTATRFLSAAVDHTAILCLTCRQQMPIIFRHTIRSLISCDAHDQGQGVIGRQTVGSARRPGQAVSVGCAFPCRIRQFANGVRFVLGTCINLGFARTAFGNKG